MKQSIYQIEKINKTKDKAIMLYKQGLTTREVGKIIGRSHQWVAVVVKNNTHKLSTIILDKKRQKGI